MREYPEQGLEDPDDDIHNDDIYFSMINKPHRQIEETNRRECNDGDQCMTGGMGDFNRHDHNDSDHDLANVPSKVDHDTNHNNRHINYFYYYINAYTEDKNIRNANHDNKHDF